MGDDILFSLFHDIGPRPSPIAVVQHSVPSNPNLQLLLCLLIDFIGGNLSYLIPLLGESFDLAWAPFQALLMGAMFDSTMPSAKWHVHPPPPEILQHSPEGIFILEKHARAMS